MDVKTFGFCVKCKDQREVQEPELKWMTLNKTVARLSGVCAECGTRISKILPKAEQEAAKAKLREQDEEAVTPAQVDAFHERMAREAAGSAG